MKNRYSTNYRMNRIFRANRAALIIPIDHGLVWGRVPSLEAPVKVLRRFLSEDITGFMLSTGLVKATEVEMAKASSLARILAIDAFWPTGAPQTGTGTLVSSVEDAVRMGVDCVKMLLPWNVEDGEKIRYCQRIGQVVSQASKWHMPVMVEPVFLNVPRTEEIIEKELEVARIAYDLGADIIKITFPGAEATAKLVAELDIPIVVAGGPLSGSTTATIHDVEEAISAGAQGIVVGRKIWQRPESQAKQVVEAMARITREKYTRHW